MTPFLLEQIIELTTNEGDMVLDPFCGSGTTCVAAKLLNRDSIGIDKSKEAIDLSKSRVAKPIKTQSALLEKGRESYVNADLNALGLLNGIKFYPVQRNKGIDAILEEQFEGAPVLIKIQRSNETLSESAELLKSAMQKKGAVKSFLLRTHKNELLETPIDHKGICVINSPSITLCESIAGLSRKN
jgi:site-specific DNA-methyltransferase (adenine-specific)